jgi:HlyD family secretion protein
LRSGLKTDVYVMTSVKAGVLRIANGPFYTGPGAYRIFVMDGNNEIKKRKLELGESSFEYVEVKGGLKVGDQVVINDMSEYKNQNKLKVK